MSWTLVFVGVVVVGFVAVLLRNKSAAFERAPWGQWPDDERNLDTIARYARSIAALPGTTMDARTWTDLDMDDVFRVLDRAESLVGQQVLYARLQSMPTRDALESFDALVSRFENDPLSRQQARRALACIRVIDGHDLWRLAQPGSFERARWHAVFPVFAGSMLTALVLIPAYPVLLFALIGGAAVSLVLRATAARHLRPVTDAFRQVGPLLAAAAALRDPVDRAAPELTAPLAADLPALDGLRRVAGWAGRDATSRVSGDLGSVVIEYLNLLFALDGNTLFFGARELRKNGAALIRVVQVVGECDAALSVASYRAGTPAWVRPSFQPPGAAARLLGVRHPLLLDPIANSIVLAPPHGIIITGSNMSGKTTFLRTIGVNAILAQTVNTCLADAYSAPRFTVRTCIGRADDPATGKSYYLVEVESVLDLVRAAGTADPHLFLFDELFRGTNTVERIAAGEAVLVSLLAPDSSRRPLPHVVVAATHDQELVDLLHGTYEPFHFTDDVDDAGLAFDYRLRPGPARTRNAIALLERRGAPADLIARAMARATALDRLHQVQGSTEAAAVS